MINFSLNDSPNPFNMVLTILLIESADLPLLILTNFRNFSTISPPLPNRIIALSCSFVEISVVSSIWIHTKVELLTSLIIWSAIIESTHEMSSFCVSGETPVNTPSPLSKSFNLPCKRLSKTESNLAKQCKSSL